MDEENKIYRLDDDISFRKCSLFDGKSTLHGDCTNFSDREENWRQYYYCNQDGIHLHCSIHPEIEFDIINEDFTRGVTEKAQFFIKPEKLQLASDHKDMDPAKVLSKIEVTLKDRKLIQNYEK